MQCSWVFCHAGHISLLLNTDHSSICAVLTSSLYTLCNTTFLWIYFIFLYSVSGQFVSFYILFYCVNIYHTVRIYPLSMCFPWSSVKHIASLSSTYPTGTSFLVVYRQKCGGAILTFYKFKWSINLPELALLRYPGAKIFNTD